MIIPLQPEVVVLC